MVWKTIALLIVTLLTGWLFSKLNSLQRLDLIKPLEKAGLGPISNNIASPPSFKPTLPSIDKIFSADHSWVATLSAQKLRTVIATGDIIPARSVNYQVLQYKDFKWPYLKTAEALKNADITFINLEAPLLAKCPVTQEGMVFCGDERNVEGLDYAGVDIASLANNHAANYGSEGVQTTVKLLSDHSILTTGVNGPAIKEIRGMKFAFLGYNDIGGSQPGISNADEEKIKQEIGEARKQSDVVIVTFHWGIEYQPQPNKRQQYLGHLAIDSGADLVIGNHPHWIQPIESYKDKLITYAHGNFVFDQMWSQKTREGVIGRYSFFDKQLVDVELLPIQIEDFGQPYFVKQAKNDSILKEMKRESLILTIQSAITAK